MKKLEELTKKEMKLLKLRNRMNNIMFVLLGASLVSFFYLGIIILSKIK